MLEVASILKNERLARPVLFLFNEGEELGLVGARAFMALSDGFVLQHLANPRPDDEVELREAMRCLFSAYA